jgi:hypothetical protein
LQAGKQGYEGTENGCSDAGRIDLDELIMNLLVVEGYKEAAEAFQREAGVHPGADLNVVEQRTKIREVVQQGDICAGEGS